MKKTDKVAMLNLTLEKIPDHIRADIGNTLFKRFIESIRDPEKLRFYNELGAAFMKRQAEKGAKT